MLGANPQTRPQEPAIKEHVHAPKTEKPPTLSPQRRSQKSNIFLRQCRRRFALLPPRPQKLTPTGHIAELQVRS